MEFKQTTIDGIQGVKITAIQDGQEVGRVFLYVLCNDLHKRPFGLLEDVFVHEDFRKQGLGSQLVKRAIDEAKARNCYKLVGYSRMMAEGTHSFYEKLGLSKWGYEFRVDL